MSVPVLDPARFRTTDLPYVVGIMRGHKKLCAEGEYHGDQDILRAAFIGSTVAGRMLLQFMGITLNQSTGELIRPSTRPDDVNAKSLGADLEDLAALNHDPARKTLIAGFIKMAHKAGAHMTIPEERPWDKTHEAIQEIEGLLKKRFPEL